MNRFKLARKMYNKNGEQSVKTVSEQTGVTGSLIDALESDYTERNVGYMTVARLAKYYGVSADFLLGLSDASSREENIQVTQNTIGLSESAIHVLRDCSEEEIRIINKIILAIGG